MNPATKNASFQRRMGAMVYDAFLLFALMMIAAIPVVAIAGANSDFFRSPLYTLYLYTISMIFFGWFWTHGGQTLGMRSWKIRVIRDDNRPLGWDSVVIRYLMATISLILFGLGFLWILFDRDNLAWHDLISRTHVIHDPDYGKKTDKSS